MTLAADDGDVSVPAGTSARLENVSLVPLALVTDPKPAVHEPSLVCRNVSSSVLPAGSPDGILQSA
jgi:hypothetical protein